MNMMKLGSGTTEWATAAVKMETHERWNSYLHDNWHALRTTLRFTSVLHHLPIVIPMQLCALAHLVLSKLSLEPDSNQWPKDSCIIPLQSSALPTELSRDCCSCGNRLLIWTKGASRTNKCVAIRYFISCAGSGLCCKCHQASCHIAE